MREEEISKEEEETRRRDHIFMHSLCCTKIQL